MPIVQLSTGAVHYKTCGAGEPLILLHANPGDSRDFEAIIPALATSYQVIVLDWPGYGQSAIPDHPESATVMLYYQVLREFLQTLSLPPAFFIGNSIGGNAAARLAIESPECVRGLVLVSPGGFTPHNVISRLFCRLQGSRWSLPPFVFANLYLKKRTSATRAMLTRAKTEQSDEARRVLNRAMWRSFSQPENDLREIAKSITAPTLLLFGKYDPAISARKDGRVASQCIPSSILKVLPCGHASFAECPDLFLTEVQAFLASCGNQHKAAH